MNYYMGNNYILCCNDENRISQLNQILTPFCGDVSGKHIIQVRQEDNFVRLTENEELVNDFSEENWIACLVQSWVNIVTRREPNKYILLHGSSMLWNGCIYIFTGGSRAGKSTALYHCLEKGIGAYLSDDIVLIDKERQANL